MAHEAGLLLEVFRCGGVGTTRSLRATKVCIVSNEVLPSARRP